MNYEDMKFNTEEIYKWIDTYQFSRTKRNINRDFSDAVPLAEILKQHFPKLVDLHNYTPKNSYAQKLINWTTLQRKVLTKLKITLPKNTLEDLARSETGVIERVLHQIKMIIDKLEAKDKDDDVYVVEGLCDEFNGGILPIKMKHGSKISDQKIVPSNIFDDMVRELEEKKEMINTLQEKVTHLEKLLAIKDERIDDLRSQIKNQANCAISSTSRFLNNIF